MNNCTMLLKDTVVVVMDAIEKCDDDVDFRSPSKGQWRVPARALPRLATVKLPRLEIIQVRTLLT